MDHPCNVGGKTNKFLVSAGDKEVTDLPCPEEDMSQFPEDHRKTGQCNNP